MKKARTILIGVVILCGTAFAGGDKIPTLPADQHAAARDAQLMIVQDQQRQTAIAEQYRRAMERDPQYAQLQADIDAQTAKLQKITDANKKAGFTLDLQTLTYSAEKPQQPK